MSPDLIPTENMRTLLKVNLARKKLRTYKSLVSEIKKEWNTFPKNLATNLVQSMKNLISDAIPDKDDFIMY